MPNPLKSSVKVGPFRFKFVEVNLNPGVEESYTFGHTQFHELTCYIHNAMQSPVKKETSFHEFMHTVFFVTGLTDRLSEDEEEHIIQTISPTIVAALQDNPEFVRYITKDE